MYKTTVRRGYWGFLESDANFSSTSVINRRCNVRNNFNSKNFNSNNNDNSNSNDLRVGLTSVQGKLELVDSLDSKSNFSSSKVPEHARHHVFTTRSMARILMIMGSFLYSRLVGF